MSRKCDETYMSVHPANLLAEWHFSEFRRRTDRAPEDEATPQDAAWPLPVRRRLAGSIWARLRRVAGRLQQIRGLLGGV
jgi:hypothetical protein